MRADRLPRGVDGAGASVGILADSFDCIGGGRAQDTASGDLPVEIAILDDTYTASCRDEGRALAQIVHDVAPRSRLGFHTAFNGQADFAEGIRELARDFAADVIVDDVLYFDEPFFQDGPIARAVSRGPRSGRGLLLGGGKRGPPRPTTRRSATAARPASTRQLGETRRHDFDPGPGVDVFQTLTLPPFAVSILVLQWDEPFAVGVDGEPARRRRQRLRPVRLSEPRRRRRALRRRLRALGLVQPGRRCARGVAAAQPGPRRRSTSTWRSSASSCPASTGPTSSA